MSPGSRRWGVRRARDTGMPGDDVLGEPSALPAEDSHEHNTVDRIALRAGRDRCSCVRVRGVPRPGNSWSPATSPRSTKLRSNC